MIIIPTYNERKNIRPLVGRIRAHMPEVPILFVDDNSPDGTSVEIRDLQKSDPNISLLTRPGKSGFASAYLDGFRLAMMGNVEFIVTMDGDLSHPPEKLSEMIAHAISGKLAVGSRYTRHGAVRNWGLSRRILSMFANFYARFFTQLPVNDATSGFMAFPASLIAKIDPNTIQNHGYAFLIELKVRLRQIGAEFFEVPIVFEERKEGESKIGRSIIMEGIRYPAKLFFRRQKQENYLAWLIFFGTLILYVATLPHTIFFGDSPEFMASVATLGIPHPPGYPGYILLAKPFTWFPFGSLEFRIGLLSALSASLSLVLIFNFLRKFVQNQRVAAAAVLIFGVTQIFWSQALMAKVYMPMLLILLLILTLLDKFLATKNKSYILTTLFLWGFGITIHEIMVLFLPILFVYFYMALRKEKDSLKSFLRQSVDLKTICIGILLFILGLSAFLYLPARANQNGIYDFSRIFRISRPGQDFKQFIDYVRRVDYKDVGPVADLKNKIPYITGFIAVLSDQFKLSLLVSIFGLLWFYRNNKFYFTVFLGVFLLNTLGVILARNAAWGVENDFLFQYYYMPAYAMMAIWVGVGFDWFYAQAKSLLAGRLVPVAAIIIAVLPVWFFIRNLPATNLSHFTFVDDYITRILNSLPPNAALLVDYENASSDTMIFGLHFKQIAQNLRPDVAVLTAYDVYPTVDFNVVSAVFGFGDDKNARYYLIKYMSQKSVYKDRPIFTTFIADDLSDKAPEWFSASNGLIYRFYDKQPKNIPPVPDIVMDYKKDLPVLEADIYGRALLSQYFYAQAAWFAENNQKSEVSENIIAGIKYDDRLKVDNSSIRAHRTRILGATQ